LKKKIILLILSSFLLISCNSEQQLTSEIKPMAININRNIKVIVDPRVELLTTIQYLANYPRLSLLNSDYKTDIDNYFKNYKNHKAVNQFKKLSKEGFQYEVPIEYILNCSALPNLETSKNIKYSSKQLQVGIKSLNEFRENVKAFYLETNFINFYAEHKNLYERILSNYTKSNEIEGYITSLENYYGKSQKSYNIILSPLIHSGGYGPRLNKENGRYDIYQVTGPIITQKIYEEYDKDIEKLKDINDISRLFELNKGVMLHEFSHSYINPLGEKYSKSIKKYEPNNNMYLEDFPNSYKQWPNIVNEYIVRAITARVLYLQDETKEYKETINNDKRSGFKYIEYVIEKLKEYENNRDRYKQIEDFYPELLDELVKQYN